eukprot:scaffold36613_cov29-Prasinocladus_malaysianus.AAC.1
MPSASVRRGKRATCQKNLCQLTVPQPKSMTEQPSSSPNFPSTCCIICSAATQTLPLTHWPHGQVADMEGSHRESVQFEKGVR